MEMPNQPPPPFAQRPPTCTPRPGGDHTTWSLKPSVTCNPPTMAVDVLAPNLQPPTKGGRYIQCVHDRWQLVIFFASGNIPKSKPSWIAVCFYENAESNCCSQEKELKSSYLKATEMNPVGEHLCIHCSCAGTKEQYRKVGAPKSNGRTVCRQGPDRNIVPTPPP